MHQPEQSSIHTSLRQTSNPQQTIQHFYVTPPAREYFTPDRYGTLRILIQHLYYIKQQRHGPFVCRARKAVAFSRPFHGPPLWPAALTISTRAPSFSWRPFVSENVLKGVRWGGFQGVSCGCRSRMCVCVCAVVCEKPLSLVESNTW